MARLIEIQNAQRCPAALTVSVGDVLLFGATGGSVEAGYDLIELLGHFLPGTLGENGQIFSPAGVPNTVLFCARKSGRGKITLVTGDPFRSSQSVTIDITVDP